MPGSYTRRKRWRADVGSVRDRRSRLVRRRVRIAGPAGAEVDPHRWPRAAKSATVVHACFGSATRTRRPPATARRRRCAEATWGGAASSRGISTSLQRAHARGDNADSGVRSGGVAEVEDRLRAGRGWTFADMPAVATAGPRSPHGRPSRRVESRGSRRAPAAGPVERKLDSRSTPSTAEP